MDLNNLQAARPFVTVVSPPAWGTAITGPNPAGCTGRDSWSFHQILPLRRGFLSIRLRARCLELWIGFQGCPELLGGFVIFFLLLGALRSRPVLLPAAPAR